jgi:uncharacterized protein YggU (UPF0235/DUF167 family)
MLVHVKVFPSASKDKVIVRGANQFEIFVRAEPRLGAATHAVARLLAEHLRIPVSQVWLKKGARERNKIFEIRT